MKTNEIIKILMDWDDKGRYVYRKQDLAKVLDTTSKTSLDTALQRLAAKGILRRVAQGVYIFAYSRNIGGYTLEEIAQSIRREEYNFLSLESALSEWGVISQIPVDRITVMTTGRKGEFVTPYGVVEFTHTKLKPEEILANTVRRDPHPLRIATKSFALRNQRCVRRNLMLIEENR